MMRAASPPREEISMDTTMPDLHGRVFVVTGATSGIGRETARELAARGATLALVIRDRARGEALRREIGGDVHLVVADLASMAEVSRAATELCGRFPAIHVLVNNAGAIFGDRELTADGFERTFALNHLAYFLLTSLLGEPLRRAAPSRVVNVSSAAHQMGKIRFDDLQLARGYSPFRAYAQSKLANILFTRELARRLEGTGVTANCLHPGTIGSNFGQSGSKAFAFLARLGRPLLAGPRKGARTTLYLATSPEVERVTGEYFVRCRVARPSRAARDPETARRLWEASEALCQAALEARGVAAEARPAASG
jgi:NAD(P)-dependent dehydrogenase (short-subunit alcohol dehydrogenase family)